MRRVVEEYTHYRLFELDDAQALAALVAVLIVLVLWLTGVIPS